MIFTGLPIDTTCFSAIINIIIGVREEEDMSKAEKLDLKDVLNIDEILAEGYNKICI